MPEQKPERLEQLRTEAEQLQLETLKARRLAAEAVRAYRDFLKALYEHAPVASANG